MSKQALYQARNRRRRKEQEYKKIFEAADQIREEHGGVGCRNLALDLKVWGCGRDKTEQLLLNNGFRIKRRRNHVRTTFAQREIYHPNRIEGLQVTGINQVVQTDITHYRAGGTPCYISLIIDVYSRYIVGYEVSRTMHASASVRALEMMFRMRGKRLNGLIHHSDRGAQYVAKAYTRLFQAAGIVQSMAETAWENAYTERLNRTIKEEYLYGWKIRSYEELKARVDQAVKHYNTKRKHRSLRALTPAHFEASVLRMPESKRPVVNIYKKKTNNQ